MKDKKGLFWQNNWWGAVRGVAKGKVTDVDGGGPVTARSTGGAVSGMLESQECGGV